MLALGKIFTKHNYNKTFDIPAFVGTVKKVQKTRTGAVKKTRDSNGRLKPVYKEEIRENDE